MTLEGNSAIGFEISPSRTHAWGCGEDLTAKKKMAGACPAILTSDAAGFILRSSAS
jgi:hypothetical protein